MNVLINFKHNINLKDNINLKQKGDINLKQNLFLTIQRLKSINSQLISFVSKY